MTETEQQSLNDDLSRESKLLIISFKIVYFLWRQAKCQIVYCGGVWRQACLVPIVYFLWWQASPSGWRVKNLAESSCLVFRCLFFVVASEPQAGSSCLVLRLFFCGGVWRQACLVPIVYFLWWQASPRRVKNLAESSCLVLRCLFFVVASEPQAGKKSCGK